MAITKKAAIKTVDEYIAGFEPAIRERLVQMRSIIQKNAPAASEEIAYGMPGYKLQGPLVYFAAFKNHIGFYATPTGHAAFEKDLSKYKQGKGSVQFPLDMPLPVSLITKIVKFRVKENGEREKAKKAVKKSA